MARLLGWTLALLALAAAAWWYYAPQSLPTPLRHAAPVSPNARSTTPTLYKWRDAQGRLNVTDAPPKDRPYEAVQYNPDTNAVPGYRRPDAPGPAEQRPTPPPPSGKSR